MGVAAKATLSTQRKVSKIFNNSYHIIYYACFLIAQVSFILKMAFSLIYRPFRERSCNIPKTHFRVGVAAVTSNAAENN